MFLFVHLKCMSWSACFLTEVAREGETLKMMRLNVPPQVAWPPLLSTNLTNISSLLSSWCNILVHLHQVRQVPINLQKNPHFLQSLFQLCWYQILVQCHWSFQPCDFHPLWGLKFRGRFNLVLVFAVIWFQTNKKRRFYVLHFAILTILCRRLESVFSKKLKRSSG